MIKALKELEIEGAYLNIIKAIYDKAIVNFILNAEQLKPFLLKSRMKHEISCSPLLFNIVPKVLG
jgi:hypothetical protein